MSPVIQTAEFSVCVTRPACELELNWRNHGIHGCFLAPALQNYLRLIVMKQAMDLEIKGFFVKVMVG